MELNKVTGVDFGGSGFRAAPVDAKTGDVDEGNMAIITKRDVANDGELTKRVLELLSEEKNIGINAAGIIDNKNLVILQSPNFPFSPITFPGALADAGKKVALANDLVGATEGFARFDPRGKKYSRVAVATYSSGHNAQGARDGICWTNHELGHDKYRVGSLIWCGCGGVDCIEYWVSGGGAAEMARRYFFRNPAETGHPIVRFALEDLQKREDAPENLDPERKEHFRLVVDFIQGKHVYQAYREDPRGVPQRLIRDSQLEALPVSFGNILQACRHPEGAVECFGLMGGMTRDWKELFEPAIERFLERPGLYMHEAIQPPREIVRCQPLIGIQGAAAYLLNH